MKSTFVQHCYTAKMPRFNAANALTRPIAVCTCGYLAVRVSGLWGSVISYQIMLLRHLLSTPSKGNMMHWREGHHKAYGFYVRQRTSYMCVFRLCSSHPQFGLCNYSMLNLEWFAQFECHCCRNALQRWDFFKYLYLCYICFGNMTFFTVHCEALSCWIW